MNRFKILKQDHKQVAQLFDEVLESSDRSIKTREHLFEEIKTALDQHAQTEENLLYPVMKEINEADMQTSEAYEEHKLMKTVLKELNITEKNTAEWLGKMKTLKDVVEHHVEEEEKTLFPMAEKLLSKEQLDEIEAKIAQYKDRFEQSNPSQTPKN